MSYLVEDVSLGLRYFSDKDMDIFMEYRNDPKLSKYQSWSQPYSKQQALHFFLSIKDLTVYSSNKWVQLIVEDKTEGEIIGDVAYIVKDDMAEFGITIRSEFQGKGLGKRSIQLLLKLLFDHLKIHRTFCRTDPENKDAVRLMNSLGLRQEGHFLQSYYDREMEEWRDELQFAILKDEFRKPDNPDLSDYL